MTGRDHGRDGFVGVVGHLHELGSRASLMAVDSSWRSEVRSRTFFPFPLAGFTDRFVFARAMARA